MRPLGNIMQLGLRMIGRQVSEHNTYTLMFHKSNDCRIIPYIHTRACHADGANRMEQTSRVVLIFNKTSYRLMSQNIEAAIFVFGMVRSLWNSTDLRQQCCRDPHQFPQRSHNYNHTSHSFKTLELIFRNSRRDLAKSCSICVAYHSLNCTFCVRCYPGSLLQIWSNRCKIGNG